ncbi:MAG: hypothetical protein ABIP17_11735 [Ilumatobacteraceae bacterium]
MTPHDWTPPDEPPPGLDDGPPPWDPTDDELDAIDDRNRVDELEARREARARPDGRTWNTDTIGGSVRGPQPVELIDWSTIHDRADEFVEGLLLPGRWTAIAAGAKAGKTPTASPSEGPRKTTAPSTSAAPTGPTVPH